MDIANASELVATRYLPLMLDGSTCMWINNLPRNSINSCEEMRTTFIENFKGTCKHPATIEDLQRCM
jgi:thioredoxin-related protein